MFLDSTLGSARIWSPALPIAVSRQLAAQIAHRQGAYFRQINTPLRIHSSGHPLWGSGSVKAQFHAV